MSETTHHEDCWRYHPGCAYERGRADERAKLSDEYRGLANNPTVLNDWMTAHGLNAHFSRQQASVVLDAVAGDIGSRLGGYTGRTDLGDESGDAEDPITRARAAERRRTAEEIAQAIEGMDRVGGLDVDQDEAARIARQLGGGHG